MATTTRYPIRIPLRLPRPIEPTESPASKPNRPQTPNLPPTLHTSAPCFRSKQRQPTRSNLHSLNSWPAVQCNEGFCNAPQKSVLYPAPSARATADETPAPMPLLVVCRTIITQGNASEAPASALVPMRPRKNPSNVITPANASKLRTFGAARRSSVGKIGPSSSSLVRAAVDGVAPLASVNDGGEIETLPLCIGNSCPYWRNWRSSSTRASWEPGGCVRAWTAPSEAALDIVCVESIGKASFLGRASEFLMRKSDLTSALTCYS